ncbi:MAG: hypothetical protein GXP05_03565 [Alphaproteobacteria bacterium]|nr:hypothetical protein [Alphaproteobacteria bacterium]
MSGCFLVSRNDGLGARLLPIISALRLGRELGIDTKIHWPVLFEGTHNTGEYASLFSEEFIRDHFLSDAEHKALNARAAPIETVLKLAPEALQAEIARGKNFAFSIPMNKTQLISESEEDVSEQYGQAISLISFSETVHTYMTEIDRVFAAAPPVAYHVRHGDLTRHYRTRGKIWASKYIPNEIYLEHMRQSQNDTGASALIFGDCPEALDWLKNHHPAAKLIGDLIALDQVNSLQRDFLELYAMSRAAKIVAPKMSGFSQMAGAIGEIEVLDIMEDLSPARLNAAFANLTERLENNRASFSNDGDAAQCLGHLVPHLSKSGHGKKAQQLLSGEIERGNTVPFLYLLWANLAFEAGDRAQLGALSTKSRDAMLFERSVFAETDAMNALLEINSDNTKAATELLRRAACLAPFGKKTRDGISQLFASQDVDLKRFYPIDVNIFQAKGLTKGITPSGHLVFDMRMFCWEVRYFLLGTMLRTLTTGGLARLMQDAISRTILRYTGRDDALVLSLESFRTLIEMEVGDQDLALKTSRALATQNPDNRMALQRYVLNLRKSGDLKTSAKAAERLVEMAPEIACYHGLLADIYYELRNFDASLDHYARANPGRADYPVFAMRHANLLRREKRFDEAEALSLDCLNETGWLDPYTVEHVRSILTYRAPVEYLPRLEKLAREGGSLRRVHNLIARLKYRQGHLEEALTYAQQAVEFTPKNVDFCLFEARMLAELGRADDAQARLDATEILPRQEKIAAEVVAIIEAR